ncbi:MAG: DUF1573 domain-containing protein [Bacteroidetes bacterium]|nr:DUF1573 domain-containing protein [Bacteroidota bacterium]
MKHLLTLAFALLISVGMISAQANNQTEELVSGAKIEFEKTVHDFGDNPQGTPVSTEFVFKNVGTTPLVLQNVKASCGCTTPYWPKEPIMPGEESKITAKYNMSKAGNFNKSITVTVKPEVETDTPEVVRLTIKGNAVVEAPQKSVEEAKPSIITNPNIN